MKKKERAVYFYHCLTFFLNLYYDIFIFLYRYSYFISNVYISLYFLCDQVKMSKKVLETCNSSMNILNKYLDKVFEEYLYIRYYLFIRLFFPKKSLSIVFGRIGLHKKIQKYDFFFKKVIAILRSICQYCISTEQYLTFVYHYKRSTRKQNSKSR